MLILRRDKPHGRQLQFLSTGEVNVTGNQLFYIVNRKTDIYASASQGGGGAPGDTIRGSA